MGYIGLTADDWNRIEALLDRSAAGPLKRIGSVGALPIQVTIAFGPFTHLDNRIPNFLAPNGAPSPENIATDVFPPLISHESPGTRTLNPLIKSQMLCQLS